MLSLKHYVIATEQLKMHHVLSEVEEELAQHAAAPNAAAREDAMGLRDGDVRVFAFLWHPSIHRSDLLLTRLHLMQQPEFVIYTLRMNESEPPMKDGRVAVATCAEDSDGDLDVPRRTAKRRRRVSEEDDVEEANCVYQLEVRRAATSWDTAGSQIWRAAFLLAEYIYAEQVCKE